MQQKIKDAILNIKIIMLYTVNIVCVRILMIIRLGLT